jgi:hypothetical protein
VVQGASNNFEGVVRRELGNFSSSELLSCSGESSNSLTAALSVSLYLSLVMIQLDLLTRCTQRVCVP